MFQSIFSSCQKTWNIMILHSTISNENQHQIFLKADKLGVMRKIILSTNIAESSITVPDVGYGKLKVGA